MEKALFLPSDKPCKLVKWKVKVGSGFSSGTVLCLFQFIGSENVQKFKSHEVGSVLEILVSEGDEIDPGSTILMVKGCSHPIVMKDMCAECGADLREDFGVPGDRKSSTSATVAMVHSVPELIVSEEQAVELGRADEQRLLKSRKLVLLVDLDETVLHTTNDTVPANLKDVYHFQLWHGPSLLWYHTKFRPHTEAFLEKISKMFELHICTFGARMYAHTMARYLDPEGKFFSHRILSRDECFDARSKTANLKALFPCGDSMVCIIDDRDEVWNFAPNMIRVKPYIFFDGTADINAPPGLDKSKGDTAENNNVKPKRQVRFLKVPKETVKFSINEPSESKNSEGEIVTYKSEIEAIKQSEDHREESSLDNEKHNSSMEIEKECIEEVMDVAESSNSQVDEMKQGQTSGETPLSENDKSDGKAPESSVKEDSGVIDEKRKADSQMESIPIPTASEILPKNESVAGEDCKREQNTDATVEKQPEKSETKQCNSTPTNNNCKKDTGENNKKQEASDKKTDDTEYEEVVEWEDEDDYLMYLEDILSRIHKAYFDMYDQIKDKENVKKEDLPNLKKIIPYVKKKVLQGSNIVFSSVVPTNQPLERSRAYYVAKSLGAEVQTEMKSGEKETTTHLVAAKMGTQKVKAAMKQKGVHLVRPDWLWTCNDRWEHVEEIIFQLDESQQYKDARDSPDVTQVKEKLKRKAENDIVDTDAQSGNASKRLFKKAKTKLEKDGNATEDNVFQEGIVNDQDIDSADNDTRNNEIIQMDYQQPSVSGIRVRRFSETINPLYSFSSKDFEDMDKEVDEILSGSSDDEEEEEESRKSKTDKIKGIDNKLDGDEDESDDSIAAEKELRKKVLSPKIDSSSEDSMSGDFPRGWKKKTSPKREYDDNRHLLEIDDPGEAKLALLKAAQSSPHWLFEESSNSQDDSDGDSIGSADEEMAAALEKELFR